MDDSICCLRYSNSLPISNSAFRNALLIGYSTLVVLYDVLNQKVIKTISLSQYNTPNYSPATEEASTNTPNLTTLAVNERLGGGHVAVGGKNGHLRVINLASAVSGAPCVDSKIQDITDLRFNRIKQSLLAGSTESGTIALWDANVVKRTCSFSEHRGPASGTAFSPINETLLLSSGLDKRCLGYDVQSRKLAATIKTDEPLTCVDFNQDGITLALGTSRGKILIYDLRSSKSPSKIIKAYPGKTVKTVAYQPTLEKKMSTKTRSASSLLKGTSKKNINMPEISKENNVPASITIGSAGDALGSPSLKLKKVDTSSNFTPFSTRFSSVSNTSTDQIFSPIGGVDTSTDINMVAANSKLKNTSNLSSNSRFSSESVFSPLRENSSNLSGNNSISHNNMGSFSQTPQLITVSKSFPSPLTMILETAMEENISVTDPRSTNIIQPSDKMLPIQGISKLPTSTALVEFSDINQITDEKSPQKDNAKNLEGNFHSKDIQLTDKDKAQTDSVFQANGPEMSYQRALHKEVNNENNISSPIINTITNHQRSDSNKDFRQNMSMKESKSTNQSSEYHSSPPVPTSIPSTFATVKPSNRPSLFTQTAQSTEPKIPVQSSAPNSATNSVKSSNMDNGMSDVKAMMIAFPDALMSAPAGLRARESVKNSRLQQNDKQLADLPEEVLDTSQHVTGNIQQFQRNYLKSIVTECMDEFTSEVRKQLWHIEFDLTRNFEALKEENNTRLELFNRMYEDVTLENQRLRDENEALKRTRHFFQL